MRLRSAIIARVFDATASLEGTGNRAAPGIVAAELREREAIEIGLVIAGLQQYWMLG
jgi:hypothetical protein